MASRYAEKTTVSVAKSKTEIEDTVKRYGANGFATMEDTRQGKCMIAFEISNRQVRFILPLPKLEDFGQTPAGRRRRDGAAQAKAHEQACRAAWRALALVIKAQFEAVETGILSFDEVFLSNIVVPGGKTVGETIIPKIGSYNADQMPKLLPG